jgi:transcriptional repressor NrdR
MRCPQCDSSEDRVVESRTLAKGTTIRRRRECLSCGYRFTSYERIQEKPLMIVKRREGRREPFDREKLEKGIRQALRKRPVSQLEIESMLDDVEEQALLIGRDGGELSSTQLGEMVLEKLYSVDRVAYVRFASVYRNFENVEEFLREIEQLTNL